MTICNTLFVWRQQASQTVVAALGPCKKQHNLQCTVRQQAAFSFTHRVWFPLIRIQQMLLAGRIVMHRQKQVHSHSALASPNDTGESRVGGKQLRSSQSNTHFCFKASLVLLKPILCFQSNRKQPKTMFILLKFSWKNKTTLLWLLLDQGDGTHPSLLP